MFSTAVIAVLSLAVAGLGYWCKKLTAKASRLEIENENLRKQKAISKTQLDIAAAPSADITDIIKRMREQGNL